MKGCPTFQYRCLTFRFRSLDLSRNLSSQQKDTLSFSIKRNLSSQQKGLYLPVSMKEGRHQPFPEMPSLVLQCFQTFYCHDGTGDSLDKSLKDFARTDFHKVVSFACQHIFHRLGPFYRGRKLCKQVFLN